jgi:small-conductance mechanosensitive channel
MTPEEARDWLQRLAANARTVQDEPASETNPTGDPHPLATRADACLATLDAALRAQQEAEQQSTLMAVELGSQIALVKVAQERAQEAEGKLDGALVAIADLRARVQRVVEAYDGYRGRGVLPAPDHYRLMVEAIEALRRDTLRQQLADLRARHP